MKKKKLFKQFKVPIKKEKRRRTESREEIDEEIKRRYIFKQMLMRMTNESIIYSYI